MATEIMMPQLGMGMFEGTILRWIVADGAKVESGDELLEIQTEKVIHTIEAPANGIVQRVAAEGEVIPVRGIIGYVLAEGEAPVGREAGEGQAAPSPARPDRGAGPSKVEPKREVRSSPIARRLAREHGVDLAAITGSGPGGRIVEADVLAAVEAMESGTASGVPPTDEETVPVTSAVSAIRPGTTEATEPLAAPGSVRPLAPEPAIAEGFEAIPVSGIRGVIFERMGQSARTVARVTQFVEVDATELVRARTQLKGRLQETDGVSVGYNDLMIMIVARGLRENQLLNSTLSDGEIRPLKEINVGLAVDTDRGLLVPVVRNAGDMGLLDVVREVRALVERARIGKSLPEDLTGGTFTITNLGMYEIDCFTPIVNLPESAILGLGRITAKPAVYQGEIAIRQMMTLSLSFDHRLYDGVAAAKFLQRVKQLIEGPHLLLM